MFQLRDDHMRGFETTAQDNFVERGVVHLRQSLSEAIAGNSDDDLRQRLHEGMDRAKKYGLITERQVIAFVDATYLVGEHFDTAPENTWAHQLLTDPALGGDSKAALLAGFAQLEANRGA